MELAERLFTHNRIADCSQPLYFFNASERRGERREREREARKGGDGEASEATADPTQNRHAACMEAPWRSEPNEE